MPSSVGSRATCSLIARFPAATLSAGSTSVEAAALTADGRWLAAGLARGEVGLWDLSGAPMMTRLSVPELRTGLVMALAFSPDSQWLAGAFMDSTVIHLWKVAAPERSELGQHSGFILHLMFSWDGRQIISADSDKFIKVWDLTERKELATLQGHRGKIIGLDLSPDGRTLVSSSTDRTLRLWNLATRREVARFEMESETYPIAFAPDGSALLFAPTRSSGETNPATVIWRAPRFHEISAKPEGE